MTAGMAVCLVPLLAGLPFYTSRRNTRGDPVTRWTKADGMHVLALLLYDAVRRGGFDPAAGSYADFLARALSDRNTGPATWPPGISN